MRFALLLGLAAFIAWLAIGQWQTPQGMIQDTTITKVDYPFCVTIKPAPLLRSPQDQLDYRLGEPFNDKGMS